MSRGQELRQDLGVELVALAGRLGDDAELLGVGQDDAPGEGFNQANEPFVAGRGFDDGFELSQLFEEPADGRLVGATQPLAFDDLTGWVHDADRDSLLVQVAAGVQHGVLLVVETETQQFTFTTFSKHTPAGSACS
jgi:hypothetical protein